MSQCPKCGTSVDHDFGVVACSGCGVILFVDLDGNLQVSGDAAASGTAEEAPVIEPASEAPAFETPPYQDFAPPENTYEAAPAEEAPASDFSNPPLQFDYATEESAAEPSPEPAPEEVDAAPAYAEDPSVMEESPVNADFAANAFDAPEVPVTTPDEQLREVAAFGNSPDEEGHALQYTIRIEGIDSKETRDRMFEILTDVRLGLNVRELQTQLIGGTLEIPQLNPVRASVIVGRLRELPLKLNWRQDVWKAT